MVSDRATWWEGDLPDGMDTDSLDGYIESEYGPPSQWDDAWFTQWVVSLNYPKGWKNPMIDGQMDMNVYFSNESWEDDRE